MRLIDADKRFEEMAYNILEEYTNCYSEVDKKSLAEYIRKNTIDIKTEVAREIFAEIEKIIFLKHRFNENRAVVEMDFEELKKIRHKYTKEGADK